MGNVHMEATQVNYREGNKKMSVAEAIKNAGSEITPEEKTWIDSIPTLITSNAGKTDQTVIAPEFDAEATYEIGDQVMYEGKLYKFTSAHETPGDWDSSEVSETTVADDLSSLENGLTNVAYRYFFVISQGTHTITNLDAGDLIYFARYMNGIICIANNLDVENIVTPENVGSISYNHSTKMLTFTKTSEYAGTVIVIAESNRVTIDPS